MDKRRIEGIFYNLGYIVALDDSLNKIYRSVDTDSTGNVLCINFDRVEHEVGFSLVNIINNEYTSYECLLLRKALLEAIMKQIECFGWSEDDETGVDALVA